MFTASCPFQQSFQLQLTTTLTSTRSRASFVSELEPLGWPSLELWCSDCTGTLTKQLTASRQIGSGSTEMQDALLVATCKHQDYWFDAPGYIATGIATLNVLAAAFPCGLL